MRHLNVASLLLIVLIAGCTEPADDAAPVQLAQAGDALATSTDAELLLRVIAAPSDMQISPDGETLTVVDRGRFIQRWRTSDYALVDVWEAEGPVTLSPGGRYALVHKRTPHRTADVVEVTHGRMLETFKPHATINLPDQISSDGRWTISTQVAGVPKLRPVGQDEPGAELTEDRMEIFAISATAWTEDTVLVGDQRGRVVLRDIAGGAETVLREGLPGHSSMAEHVSDLALGKDIAAAAISPTGTLVWDTKTGREIAKFPKAIAIALSPDQKRLALVTRERLEVADLDDGSTQIVLQNLQPWIAPAKSEVAYARRPQWPLDIGWTADGHVVASGSFSGLSWIWRQGEAASATPLAPTPFVQRAVPIAAGFDAEGGLTVWARGLTPKSLFGNFPEGASLTAEDDRLRRILRWRVPAAPGEEPVTFEVQRWHAAAHPQGGVIVTATDLMNKRTVRAWSAEDASLIAEFPEAHADAVISLSGERMALSDANDVRVHALPDGDLVKAFEQSGMGRAPSSSIALDADGSRLAVIDDQAVAVFEVHSGAQIARISELGAVIELVAPLALSPSGDRLAVATREARMLYDVEAGERIGEIRVWPWQMKFSPDGNTIAAANPDGTVTLLNGHTGETRAALQPSGGVRAEDPRVFTMASGSGMMFVAQGEAPSLSFSDDSRLLASVGDDGTVAVTDVEAGEVLVRLMWVGGPGVPDGGWIAWTPGGRYDGTEEAIEACIRFRDGDQVVPASEFPQLHVEGLIDEMLGR